MQGTVDWGQLVWVVVAMLSVGSGVAAIVTGFLFWIWKQLKERDTAAQLEQKRAQLIEGELRRDLASFREEVAKTYATKDGMTAALGRVEQSVGRVEALLHEIAASLNQRLDNAMLDRPRSGQ